MLKTKEGEIGALTLEQLEERLFGGASEGLSSIIRTDGERMLIMVVGKMYVTYVKGFYPTIDEGLSKLAEENGVELDSYTAPEDEDSDGSSTKH